MKKQNLIRLLFFFGLVALPITIFCMNVQAYKDEPVYGCHNKSNYTISANVSSIQSEAGGVYSLEIIATGTNVVIDVYADALDNELFVISPGNIIADGDASDTNPASNAIEVILEITMPSSDGQYTLRILSREPSTSGIFDLWYLDLTVTVGIVIKPPLLLLLENYNLFIGGFAVISIFLGTLIFKMSSNRTEFPKAHSVFMVIAFILTTLNFFLILNDTIYIVNLEMILTSSQYIGQFNHVLLGSIGYISGIIAVFGTFMNVPRNKLQFAIYIMLFGWMFNFINGILIPTPTYNFGSLF